MMEEEKIEGCVYIKTQRVVELLPWVESTNMLSKLVYRTQFCS